MRSNVRTTSKTRDGVKGSPDGGAYTAIRWHNVRLDDGRTVQLFVNLDTNLVVLDILDQPNRRGNVKGGVEVYRRNI